MSTTGNFGQVLQGWQPGFPTNDVLETWQHTLKSLGADRSCLPDHWKCELLKLHGPNTNEGKTSEEDGTTHNA